MPVVKMQKVALLAHSSLREELLEFLQDRAVMEVSPNEETQDIDHPEMQHETAEVLFAIEFLKPYATPDTIKKMRKYNAPEDIRRSALHTDFRSVIDDCKKLQNRMTETKAREQQLLTLQEQLLPWRELQVSTNKMAHLFFTTNIVLGSIPTEEVPTFAKELEKAVPRTTIEEISSADGVSYLTVYVWGEDRDQFEQTACMFPWEQVMLPSSEQTPRQQLRQASIDLRLAKGNLNEINIKLNQLSKKLPDLVHLVQFLHWLSEKQHVRSELSQTNQTIELKGWVALRNFQKLNSELEARFPAVALLGIDPEEGEDPPIQIFNTNSIAPFEAVTRLYGLPQKGEMDPTRPLMPFFILYFGLCLTDAGYGLVIAAFMTFAILKFKIKRQEMKLIWLLLYAGIVTFFVSIPFGGWFGMTPAEAPTWAVYTNVNGDLRFLGQIWDLQKDVTFFQNLALSLGAIQLLFGIFLAGYWKWIHGKKFEAFASHFSVHLFVIALALKFGLQLPRMEYALIAIGALFVWGQGSGVWWVRPLLGVLGAMNFCIGMMSNILSYLRILALGLATGALAFAINQIAFVISDLLPAFLGIPVFIVILVFGHLISIALNSLGSFVHSGRLQFIEFFGQFFQGGGREFAPFKRTVRSVS